MKRRRPSQPHRPPPGWLALPAVSFLRTLRALSPPIAEAETAREEFRRPLDSRVHRRIACQLQVREWGERKQEASGIERVGRSISISISRSISRSRSKRWMQSEARSPAECLMPAGPTPCRAPDTTLPLSDHILGRIPHQIHGQMGGCTAMAVGTHTRGKHNRPKAVLIARIAASVRFPSCCGRG